MELIKKYFPSLSPLQYEQFAALAPLYTEWNAKINVVSRKDIEELYERHVLHSLGIAKVISFKGQTTVLDIGTGGGFPGIPLAIVFPEVHFHLVDSIGKKITVVKEVAQALKLDNVEATHARVEKLDNEYDFVVSRGVTRVKELQDWVQHKFNKHYNNKLKNGLLLLKGGDLTEELNEAKAKHRIFELAEYFQEPFFETKKVVHVPMI